MSNNPKISQTNAEPNSIEKNDIFLHKGKNSNDSLYSDEYMDMETENHNSTNAENKESSSSSNKNKNVKSNITISINTTNIINPQAPSNEDEEDEKEEKKKRKKSKSKKEKFDKNLMENNLKETQTMNDNLLDEKAINKIINIGKNNNTKKVIIELIESETTNNICALIQKNLIFNCINCLNEKAIYVFEFQPLNLVKKFFSNYSKCIVNRIKKNFDSEFKLINMLENITLIINFEKEKNELLEIFKGNIKDLLLGEFCNLNSEEKEVAKKENELISTLENKNKKEKIKVLNHLFSEELKEKFKMYLNDCLFIKKGDSNFNLKEFQTFKDDFNEYKPEIKQIIKKYVCSLLDCELTNFEKSSKEDNTKTEKIKNINHYDSRRIIINAGKKSFFDTIKNYVFIKYGIELYTPVLKNKLKCNVKQYENCFNKNLKFFFSDLIPKNFKKGKNYSEQINEVLKIEEESEEENNRILAKLLNLVDIKSYLRAYINDENIIEIKDNNGNLFLFCLPNLKTFKYNFSDIQEEIKEDYRKDFIKLLDGEIKSRKSSEKRNSKLKNNNKLIGRKTKRSK